jgi:hypothetical protein
VAGEGGHKDSGHHPDASEAGKDKCGVLWDYPGKYFSDQKANGYPTAAHIGNVQHTRGILGLLLLLKFRELHSNNTDLLEDVQLLRREIVYMLSQDFH